MRIRLNGIQIPEINVHPDAAGNTVIDARDTEIGWFEITDDFVIEVRDEESWGMLPLEMRKASKDKGYQRIASATELIQILQLTGAIK